MDRIDEDDDDDDDSDDSDDDRGDGEQTGDEDEEDCDSSATSQEETPPRRSKTKRRLYDDDVRRCNAKNPGGRKIVSPLWLRTSMYQFVACRKVNQRGISKSLLRNGLRHSLRRRCFAKYSSSAMMTCYERQWTG